MHNKSVDAYYCDKIMLVKNFKNLITRNFSLIKNEKELSEVDLCINSFHLHLMVHEIHIHDFYPLKDTYNYLKSGISNLDEKQVNALTQIIDLNAKSSFISMCGFQIETILKKIAKPHNICIDNGSMRTKFQCVLKFFEIPSKDNLDLIDIFYWTRNTLHNGGIVDKQGEILYQTHTYKFEKNKEMEHATWDYYTYFVCKIIGIFEEILNSKKYKV